MHELPVVFISEPIHAAGMKMLKGKVQIIQAPDTDRNTTIKLIENADAVILRATTIFDREVIGYARKLKIIARTGVGVNNVDIPSATEAGIYVVTRLFQKLLFMWQRGGYIKIRTMKCRHRTVVGKAFRNTLTVSPYRITLSHTCLKTERLPLLIRSRGTYDTPELAHLPKRYFQSCPLPGLSPVN